MPRTRRSPPAVPAPASATALNGPDAPEREATPPSLDASPASSVPIDALLEPLLLARPTKQGRHTVDAVVLGANGAALEFLGLPSEELIGRSLSAVRGFAQSEWLRVLWRTADTGRPEVLHGVALSTDAPAFLRRCDLRATRVDGSLALTWHDVTPLHEMREEYRRLVENTTDIVVELAPDGLITWVSPNATSELGWRVEDVVGEFLGGVTHPDFVATYEQRVAALDTQGYGVTEAQLRDAEGTYHHFAVAVRNVCDEAGSVTSRIASLHNIDREVVTRESLQNQYRRLGDALQAELDPHIMLRAIRDEPGNIVDFEITEVNSAGLVYNRVIREGYVGSTIRAEHPALARSAIFDAWVHTMETGEPLVLDDFVYHPADSAFGGHYDIRAVRVGDELSHTWRDVTTRVELTEQYRLLAENASDVVFRTDVNFQLEWVSPSVQDLLGQRPDQVIGHPVTEFFHPDDLDAIQRQVFESSPGQHEMGEFRLRTGGGEYRWVSLFARSVHDGGSAIGYVGSVRDAQATREKRDELAASEARYRLLAENASDVVAVGDGDGVLTWVSESVTSLMGWPPSELVGRRFVELIHPDDVTTVDAIQPALRRGSVERYEARVRTATGGYRWVSFSVHDVVNPRDDSVSRIASWRDAQSDVENRQAVAESETQYRLLAENASDVVAMIDAASRFAWVSPSAYEVLGWKPGEIVGRPADDFIEAGDLERVFASHPSMVSDVARVSQLRFRRADGSFLWVSARSAALPGDRRGTAGRVVAFRDVTAEVTAREALLASEARYRTLAENVSDVVVQIDAAGAIQWVSPSLQRVLGWLPEQWIGQRAMDFVHEDDRERIEPRPALLPGGSRGAVEVRYRAADGTYHCVSSEAHRIHAAGDDAGESRVVGLRSIDAEVTARQSLAQTEERYRLLAENASDVVLQTDLDGTIEWISPSVQQFLGWAWRDLIGLRTMDFVFAEDAPKVSAFRTLVGMGQKIDDYEIRCRAADGELRWVSVRVRPMTDDAGTVTGIILSLRNCQAEVLARRALTTLSQGSRALTRAGDEQTLLQRMCQVAVDDGGYQFAWYGRKVNDASFSVEKLAASEGHHEYLDAVDLTWGEGPLGMGPTGRAIRLDETVVVRDIRSDARFSPWLDLAMTHGFRGSISLPVHVDGEVDGAFMVYAREPDAFDDDTIDLMENLADEIGYGLQRCRDQGRLAKSQSDQLMLSRAVEQAVESVLILDADFRIVYANPSATRTSGYSLEEIVGQKPGDVFGTGLYPEEFYDALWGQLYSGQSWHGTFLNRRKSGEIYEEDSTVSPIHDAEGALVAFVEVKHDVTAERKLESDLTRVRGDRDAVLDVMREIRPAKTLEATAWMFCDAATRLADIDVAAILLLERDGRLRPVAISGSNIFGSSEPFSTDAPEVMSMVAHGPIALTMDPQQWRANPHLLAAARGEGIIDLVLAPIRWEGRLIALLVVGTRNPDVAKDSTSRFAHFEELGAYAGTLFGAMAVDYEHRNAVRAEVDAVISGGRFRPRFQPLVNLTTGDVVGFEALTTFDDQHPPGERFADAHYVGRGPELEAACAAAAIEAARNLAPGVFLSVNFAPATILSGRAAAVVRESSRQIVIEITEHAPIDDYALVRQAVDAIGGCQLAVDDAGAGYTSLSHILELRPEYVKLDISLVRDIDRDPARQAMVAGVCHFAEQTGTIIVAEGVETPAEADTLRDLGVTLGEGTMLAQGYYFGRPAPAV
ncbi:MAG: PAS domain S-box protein [Acidimicrobiales bacterium]